MNGYKFNLQLNVATQAYEYVAASTAVSFELMQEVVETADLPGEGDGWKRFKPGYLSWSLSSDGFFTDDSEMIDHAIAGTDMKAKVNLGSTQNYIIGSVHTSEVSVSGDIQSLSKVSCKYICDGFPDIYQSI